MGWRLGDEKNRPARLRLNLASIETHDANRNKAAVGERPYRGPAGVPPDRIVGILDSCYIRKQWNSGIGRVAQLGERGVRNAEVEGSNPFASTKEQRVLQPSERRITKPSYRPLAATLEACPVRDRRKGGGRRPSLQQAFGERQRLLQLLLRYPAPLRKVARAAAFAPKRGDGLPEESAHVSRPARRLGEK